jgi:transcriptional regulator with XRE-family HTH domain
VSASSAIRKRLDDIGMTQIQLAEALGTNRQNLGNKLRRDNFSARELEAICKIIGLKLAMVEGNPGEYVIEYTQENKE